MSDSTLIELEFPRKVGSESIKSLSIRRPRVKDMKLFDEFSGIDGSVKMLSELANVPVAVIEELDAADFMRASEVIEGFLPDAQDGKS